MHKFGYELISTSAERFDREVTVERFDRELTVERFGRDFGELSRAAHRRGPSRGPQD